MNWLQFVSSASIIFALLMLSYWLLWEDNDSEDEDNSEDDTVLEDEHKRGDYI